MMNDREPCDYRMQQEFEQAEWYAVNHKLVDEIHVITEMQIKPCAGHLVQPMAQRYCANTKGT